MTKKLIRLTPDELGYKDRGKMKWQGLMLSDHLDALRIMDKEDNALPLEPKRMMSEIEISKILQQSYINKQPITLQANVVNNNNYYPDLQCIVLGSQDNKIYLQLKDGRITTCQINQIRHVEFMNINEWYVSN